MATRRSTTRRLKTPPGPEAVEVIEGTLTAAVPAFGGASIDAPVHTEQRSGPVNVPAGYGQRLAEDMNRLAGYADWPRIGSAPETGLYEVTSDFAGTPSEEGHVLDEEQERRAEELQAVGYYTDESGIRRDENGEIMPAAAPQHELDSMRRTEGGGVPLTVSDYGLVDGDDVDDGLSDEDPDNMEGMTDGDMAAAATRDRLIGEALVAHSEADERNAAGAAAPAGSPAAEQPPAKPEPRVKGKLEIALEGLGAPVMVNNIPHTNIQCSKCLSPSSTCVISLVPPHAWRCLRCDQQGPSAEGDRDVLDIVEAMGEGGGMTITLPGFGDALSEGPAWVLSALQAGYVSLMNPFMRQYRDDWSQYITGELFDIICAMTRDDLLMDGEPSEDMERLMYYVAVAMMTEMKSRPSFNGQFGTFYTADQLANRSAPAKDWSGRTEFGRSWLMGIDLGMSQDNALMPLNSHIIQAKIEGPKPVADMNASVMSEVLSLTNYRPRGGLTALRENLRALRVAAVRWGGPWVLWADVSTVSMMASADPAEMLTELTHIKKQLENVSLLGGFEVTPQTADVLSTFVDI